MSTTESTLDVPKREPVSIHCKFGRASFGIETISLSMKCGRGALPTEDGGPAIVLADELLTDRRLNVVLTNKSEQGELFDDQEGFEPITVRCIVDTAGLACGKDTFGVTMNVAQQDLTQEQMDDIQHLAQREGRMVIHDVSAKIKEEPHPDVSDDSDDPDKVTAGGGTLFAAVKKIALDSQVAELGVVTEKQATALVTHGYGTIAAIAELRENVGPGYADQLATVPGMSKKASKALAEQVELFLAKDAAKLDNDGRLMCNGCGQLWDTAEDVEDAEELDQCPFCGSEDEPLRMRDDRVDADGCFPESECERIQLATVPGCTASVLLVEDEFGSWRSGVKIDADGVTEAGFLPTFDEYRRDRQAAIKWARLEALDELDDVQADYDLEAAGTCKAAIQAALSQPVK